MTNKLHCVMLVDDDADDNFFHKMAIMENHFAEHVIVQNSARKALSYLKEKTDPTSELIFLDINMPGMTGWDFLSEYERLENEMKSKAIIIMLSTSANSRDIEKSKSWEIVSDYITKPLTKEIMQNIIEKHFQEA